MCLKKALLSAALYPGHSLEAEIRGRTRGFLVFSVETSSWALSFPYMCISGYSPNLEFLLPLQYAGCYFLIPADSISPSCAAALPQATALCLCISVTCRANRPFLTHLPCRAEDTSHQADLRKRREMVAICLLVLIFISSTCDQVEKKTQVTPGGEKMPFFFLFFFVGLSHEVLHSQFGVFFASFEYLPFPSD